MGAATVAACLAGSYLSFNSLNAQQRPGPEVTIDSMDLGGVVTSQNGVEAGGWGIAETTDLSTKVAKAGGTDDRGRYVVPRPPKTTYNVWVRGHGLIDSPKVKAG